MAKTKEKFHDPNQQKFANIKGFSLVAPAVFLISLFTVYPIIFTLYWAFHSGNLIFSSIPSNSPLRIAAKFSRWGAEADFS